MAAEILAGEIRDDNLYFEPLPDWTEEDFTKSSVPHAWVMEQGGGDPYKTLRYRDMAAAAAKKLGIRNFVSQYNKYAASHRSEIDAPVRGNASDFEGQPMELLVGDYIATDATGIVLPDRFRDTVQVCCHPIMPIKRLINVDTGEVQIEIAFRRGEGGWRTMVVPKTMLSSASMIAGMSAWGVGVDSENAKALVRYFTAVEHLNYNTMPEINSVGRMGWIREDLFSPYMDGLQFDGDPSQKKAFDAVRPWGNYAAWLSVAQKAREGSKAVQIALAASFASALVKPCECLPFLVHLWGSTGAGKTVALKLAASVWACPNDEGGFVRSFNTTAVGLEMAAAFANSLPLCIDELQVVKDRKSFDDIIYMLAEGIGRVRGAKTGGLQAMRTWRNCTITTGEMPISSSNSGGGAVNRVIEVNYKDEKLFEDPREVVSVITENYGIAGKRFVELLMNNMELARELQRDYFQTLCKSDTTEKQALSASLLLTADHLISLWFFGKKNRLSPEDIAPYLSSKEEADANSRALEWLYGWIAEHANSFAGSGDAVEIGTLYGRAD